MASTVLILFPHQLFATHKSYQKNIPIFLVEEVLFFKQFNFHKQKLAFHRASMKAQQQLLEKQGFTIEYIESINSKSDVRKLIEHLSNKNCTTIEYINPTDNWLEKRIENSCKKYGIKTKCYENPLFINTKNDLKHFFKPDKKSYFQTTFYKQQRKKHHILLDQNDDPKGGKWSFDHDNRKQYPKDKTPPHINFETPNANWSEAVDYIEKNFGNNIGNINNQIIYPYTKKDAEKWLDNFLEERFYAFGPYEDAIAHPHYFLHHSILTPMLNVGLLSPMDIINKAISYGEKHDIAINSIEGFVRQILGWREFIRGMYECKGSYSRTKNFWGFSNTIPKSFYTGNTGIIPIDKTIKKVLKTGYCHHIERLMILGNFMLLCEIDPDEVYQWFMELFIDAYDWVMVPNVYGMSQFADGGLFATKPYISSANYVLKMSNYAKGDWQETWDALFWRFMYVHRDFFEENPRLKLLLSNLDKMPKEKLEKYLIKAEEFIATL